MQEKEFPKWRWTIFGNATVTREEHQKATGGGGLMRKMEKDNNERFARCHDQYLRPVMMILGLERWFKMF